MVFGGIALLNAQETKYTCEDLGCKGASYCVDGVKEFKGCEKDNPCIGGGSVKCQKPNI